MEACIVRYSQIAIRIGKIIFKDTICRANTTNTDDRKTQPARSKDDVTQASRGDLSNSAGVDQIQQEANEECHSAGVEPGPPKTAEDEVVLAKLPPLIPPTVKAVGG